MQYPGFACCREVCIKPRLAYKTPGMEKESRLAPAPRYLMHRAAPRSERPAHHQLVARAGFLGFQLELVMVASQLVVDRVELVEDLVLGRIEQVGRRQAHRQVPAEALLDESLQVVAVADGDFLADDAFVRIALLAVRHAEAGVQRRQVLDEADVERRPGLFVEARSEEHTSELQSLMRISYAVFCLKKKKK